MNSRRSLDHLVSALLKKPRHLKRDTEMASDCVMEGVGLKLRVSEILLERFKRRENKMTGS